MARTDIMKIARNKWHLILSHFGIDEKYLSGKQESCPLCDGKNRFLFTNKAGDGMYSCKTCGTGAGINLLMCFKDISFNEARKAIKEFIKVNDMRKLTSQNKINSIGHDEKFVPLSARIINALCLHGPLTAREIALYTNEDLEIIQAKLSQLCKKSGRSSLVSSKTTQVGYYLSPSQIVEHCPCLKNPIL